MKKLSTTHLNFIFLSASAMALAFTTLAAQSAGKAHDHKNDILHLFLQKKMANEGVIADASGQVDIHENLQSKGKAQDLRIKVKDLDANAAYSVFALAGSDTNLNLVAGFSTDGKGKASIEFRDKGPGKSEGKGKNKNPLPPALDPVSGIRELTIVDANEQTVLTADLTSPDKLEYLLKRDLSTGSVEASLQIKGKVNKATIRLEVSGLSPNSQYSLALNGSVAQTGSTDENGKLKINSELEHPLDILALQNVDLVDSTDSVVVSTTLP